MKINNKYKVLNHQGDFVDFTGIQTKITNETIRIVVENGLDVETTLTHTLIGREGEVFSKDLSIGDEVLTTIGFQRIKSVEIVEKENTVYDLIDVGKDSLYVTNGIISHNCSFLGSGNNFIDNDDLKRLEDTQQRDPIRMEYEEMFWIWEEPQPNTEYIISIDVSTGTGDDNSTIEILKQNNTHMEQVAEFKGKVSPDTLGVIAFGYGKRYNGAFAIIDVTGGIGAMTAKTMLEMGYTNMYYSNIRNETIKAKLQDYVRKDDKGNDLVPGFTITASNRGLALTEMKRAIEQSEIIIRSYRLISEFKTFISKDGTRIADHRRSFHDDLIMAIAMAVFVYSFDILSLAKSLERRRKMMDSIVILNTKNEPKKAEIDTTYKSQNPYNQFSWLFK